MLRAERRQLQALHEVVRQRVEGLAVVLLQLSGVAEHRDVGIDGHLRQQRRASQVDQLVAGARAENLLRLPSGISM